jgi:DNA polymerase-4
MNNRVAAIYIPDFQIETLFRENISLVSKPVVLTRHGRMEIISERAEKASAGRIEKNLTIAQGRSLCQNLVVLPRDIEKEKLLSKGVLQSLQKIAPHIEEESPGIYFLDTSGLALLYKSEKTLAKKIIDSMRTLLLPVKIGIAKNKFIARVAAEISERSGFTIITAGAEERFLKNLPTVYLDVAEETRARLADLGIKTIGEASEFNMNEFALRFGREGDTLSLHSKGDDHTILDPDHPVDSLSDKIALSYSIDNVDAIISHVEKLIEKLLDRIRSRGYAADSASIDLKLDDRSKESIEIRLDKPSSTIDKFTRQIRFKLEKIKLSSGVTEIAVALQNVCAQISEQLELPHRTKVERSNVLDGKNLIDIPDFKKLCLPVQSDSFLPEREFALSPTQPNVANKSAGRQTGSDSKANIVAKSESGWKHPYSLHIISGLRLLQPQREIRMISNGDLPQTVIIDNIAQKIAKKIGPWRISGGWWEDCFDRMYYEIETTNGKLLLVYHDQISSRWFMHGVFD